MLAWSSVTIVRPLVNAYKEGVKVTNDAGWLPLHSLKMLNLLIEVYPESIDLTSAKGYTPAQILKKCKYPEKRDENGMIQLHHTYARGFSVHLVNLLTDVYPQGLTVKDNQGNIRICYDQQGRRPPNRFNTLLPSLILSLTDAATGVVAPEAYQVGHVEIVPQVTDTSIETLVITNELKTKISQVELSMRSDTAIMKTNATALKSKMSEMKSNMTERKTEMSETKTEVEAEMSEMKTEMAELNTEMYIMKSEMIQVGADLAAVKSDMAKIKLMVGSILNI
jgi:hypothetical protein